MQQDIKDNPPSTPISPSARYSNQHIGIFVIGALLILVILATAILSLHSHAPTKSTTSSSLSSQSQALNLAPYTLVYGTWRDSSSLIKAVNLTSGKLYNLASLPSNVKHVSVLDANRLAYIANTDSRDHGTSINIHDINSNTNRVIIKASPGFGIDDYVLSPNKQYLADWEVVASSSG